MSTPVALITGASIGIGEQFARQLCKRGHDVVLVARDSARLEALAKEIEDQGGSAEVLPADLTDADQLAMVEARVRSVDLLVNNAGFGTFGAFHTLDVDTETREINLNVIALVRLTHAAAAAMAERGRGGILNVS
jgi:short-subunit dehydrogenase